ncbi:transporter substrate-binding domain-containing protein [Acetobacteraceae bacterium KSS8]|uniref:Transporter substrate-binding domain-containing protein n=1 Tax=Endosaccharibacter trunci TaxID=2812733 RepID=A0ABT1W5G6_9PROT|nr:transporter substrate-binding domain-containing protein [Acetobacteraceae bacterium KSS8]
MRDSARRGAAFEAWHRHRASLAHSRLRARRRIATAALLAAALFGGYARARAADEASLRVADQKGLVHALLDASHALDGAPYHIDWSEFENAAPLLQAINADAVDTGIAGDGPFLFAFGAGQDVRATQAVLPRAGGRAVAIVVPSGSPIRTLADLAGRRIATTRGSIGHELLLALEQDGRLRSPGPLVTLSPAQAAAALRAGSVAAWSTWEPYVALTEAQGGHRIADGTGVLANYAFQVSNHRAIAEKHALLQDFYHRLALAYAWGNDHPDQYAAIWSRQVGMPLALSVQVADEMRTHAAPIGDDIIAAEQKALDSYRVAGILPPGAARPLSEAFDRSFTP